MPLTKHLKRNAFPLLTFSGCLTPSIFGIFGYSFCAFRLIFLFICVLSLSISMPLFLFTFSFSQEQKQTRALGWVCVYLLYTNISQFIFLAFCFGQHLCIHTTDIVSGLFYKNLKYFYPHSRHHKTKESSQKKGILLKISFERYSLNQDRVLNFSMLKPLGGFSKDQ